MRYVLSGGQPVGFSWAVVLAFVRLATRVGLFPRPLELMEVIDVVETWLAQPPAILVEARHGHLQVVARLLESAGSTGGNLVNDAHLAAGAVQYRATVVSFDLVISNGSACPGRSRPSADRPALCSPGGDHPAGPAGSALEGHRAHEGGRSPLGDRRQVGHVLDAVPCLVARNPKWTGSRPSPGRCSGCRRPGRRRADGRPGSRLAPNPGKARSGNPVPPWKASPSCTLASHPAGADPTATNLNQPPRPHLRHQRPIP